MVLSWLQEKTDMRFVRLLIAASAIALPLTPAFAPTPAAAQTAPASNAPSICTGNINIVRISEIKPGMMQKFLDAVAAQKAWYKNAGTPDEISVMRIMEQNPDTKAYTFSETQAITTHTEPASQTKGPAHDAAWDTFVTMFKDSSTIKTQYITCVATM
jgi:hypothetical protein